jgi:DNA-binding HxlR family transcriptional regulator
MVKRLSLAKDPCPVARSLDLVGDWWTLLIVRNALSGTRRFGDFQKELGVSKSMLAERLQKMVQEGLLEIRPDPEGSAYSEYHLTEKGRRLRLVLMALRQWGEDNLFEPGEAMNVLTDARDDAPVRRLELLSADGRILDQGDVRIARGKAAVA